MKFRKLLHEILKIFLVFKKLITQDIIFTIIILIVVIFYFTNRNSTLLYNQLDKKGIKTVGFIKNISTTKTRKYVKYKYSVEGKIYNGSQQIDRHEYNSLLNSNFYPIIYHIKDPNVSELLTSSKNLSPTILIDEGILIDAKITNILEGHKPYLDLYIDYKLKEQNYSFRTRLHQDSLNCGSVEKCKNDKIIRLKVSKKYPFFNDLYFKSRDRQKRKFQHLD